MLHRIWTEQICLVSKLLHKSDKGSYCRQILEEQTYMGWDGLAKEADEACRKVGLPDVRRVEIPRGQVKEAVLYFSVAEVKQEMNSTKYKKLEKIKYLDGRQMQQYMKDKSLEDSRLEFRWLTEMLDTRTTMPGRYGGRRTCPHCPEGREGGQEESPSHLLSCLAYRGLRVGKDPELVRKDRCRYLREVIKVRSELEAKL